MYFGGSVLHPAASLAVTPKPGQQHEVRRSVAAILPRCNGFERPVGWRPGAVAGASALGADAVVSRVAARQPHRPLPVLLLAA